MAKISKKTIYIKGMHCPSCEILITDKFKEMPNVATVSSNFKKQEAEVYFTGHLDQDIINEKIQPFGYEIGNKTDKNEVQEPMSKKVFEAFLITVGLVLILGLVASISTCMATSGALFLSTIGNKTNNLKQAIYFSLGRIISYGFFGFIAGAVGSIIITNLKFGTGLTLLAAVFMILLGLDMLKIISFAAIIPFGATSNIFRKLEHMLIKDPHKSAFFLGAITYFLPCGFTQATQVYALGLASPWQSALTMAIFAIGTAPAIIFIGSLRGLLKSTFYQYFMKTVAVGVLILGFYYISNFLAIYGVSFSSQSNESNRSYESNMVDGKQVIKMDVV